MAALRDRLDTLEVVALDAGTALTTISAAGITVTVEGVTVPGDALATRVDGRYVSGHVALIFPDVWEVPEFERLAGAFIDIDRALRRRGSPLWEAWEELDGGDRYENLQTGQTVGALPLLCRTAPRLITVAARDSRWARPDPASGAAYAGWSDGVRRWPIPHRG